MNGSDQAEGAVRLWETTEASPPRTRVQRVIGVVAAHIRESRLQVGDQLPSESEFCETAGVSRSVVREAFGALAALGVLDVGNGRRPRVGNVNALALTVSIDHALHTGQVTAVQVWEVRRCLEVSTASLAAIWRTEEEAIRLLEISALMFRTPPHSAKMADLDVVFHSTIAKASRNPLFSNIIQSFRPLMMTAIPTAWSTRSTPEEAEEALDNHIAIARAIADRDASEAQNAMQRHFDRNVASLMQAQFSYGDA